MMFKMFTLLLRCFAYAPFRGLAHRVPKVLARIGVVQLAKLGDMVCTTPIFAALKRAYPQAQVVVVGNTLNRELLTGHPHVDEYVVWGQQTLRGLKLDVVLLATPNTEALAAAYLAGAPSIICPRVEGGWSPYETRSYRLLRTLCTTVPHRMGHYAPQEFLNALAPFGIRSTDTSKELFITTTVQAAVDAKLAPYTQTFKVAIAPGAGNKIKEWPPERFNEVAKHLVGKKDALVVIIGGPADTGLAKIVAKDLPQGSILDTTGKLSIEELKGLIKRISLFVSADTGPIYVAEAFDVPTVDIVGPTDEHEQPPLGQMHKVVVSYSRTNPQLHVMNARVYDAEEARRQVDDISVQQVIMEIEKLTNSL